MKKLWVKDKNSKLNPLIETFETKDDILLDQKLVKYDVLGSIAHAKMLNKINILSDSELKDLEKGLKEILDLNDKGKFQLKFGDEDIHTKIENFLTENYGKAGKKIHTGRSRNDQVLTAIRLFSKDKLNQIEEEILVLIKEFKLFIKKYGEIKMPGYTHMQKAMPSSIKIWAGSFEESLTDDLLIIKAAQKINNQSPLGSAAGYGVSLPLNKNYTAKILGFEKIQNNPLYCQNSKGKIEGLILSSLIQMLLTINKFASDVMLFTTSEFDFFEVSGEITSGSSIMPQKKNIDAAELLRSKVHLVLGNYTQIVSMSSNLISGYNRDLQDIKKPLFESLDIALNSIKVTIILLKGINPNKNNLKKSLTEDLFAAEKVFEMVKKGVPFRDAYQKIGSEITEKEVKQSVKTKNKLY